MERCHLHIRFSTHGIVSYLLSEEVVLLAQDCIKFAFPKLSAIFYSLILRILIFYGPVKTKLVGILLQQRKYVKNFLSLPKYNLEFSVLIGF